MTADRILQPESSICGLRRTYQYLILLKILNGSKAKVIFKNDSMELEENGMWLIH